MTLYLTLANAGGDWDGGWHVLWFPFVAVFWVGLGVLVTWLIMRRRAR